MEDPLGDAMRSQQQGEMGSAPQSTGGMTASANFFVMNTLQQYHENDAFVRPEGTTENQTAWLEFTSIKTGPQWKIETQYQNLGSYIPVLDRCKLRVTCHVTADNKPLSSLIFYLKDGSNTYEIPIQVRFLGLHSFFNMINVKSHGPMRSDWTTSPHLFREFEISKLFNTRQKNRTLGTNLGENLEVTSRQDLTTLPAYQAGALKDAASVINLNHPWFTQENYDAVSRLSWDDTVTTFIGSVPHNLFLYNSHKFSSGFEFTMFINETNRREEVAIINPFLGKVLKAFKLDWHIPADGITLCVPVIERSREVSLMVSPQLDMVVLNQDVNQYPIRNSLNGRRVDVIAQPLKALGREFATTLSLAYIPRRVLVSVYPFPKLLGEEGWGARDPRESALKGVTKARLTLMGNEQCQWNAKCSPRSMEMCKMYENFMLGLRRGNSAQLLHDYELDFDAFCDKYFFVPFVMDHNNLDERFRIREALETKTLLYTTFMQDDLKDDPLTGKPYLLEDLELVIYLIGNELTNHINHRGPDAVDRAFTDIPIYHYPTNTSIQDLLSKNMGEMNALDAVRHEELAQTLGSRAAMAPQDR